MNMYLHELRVYRKSTIIWAISLSLVAILMISVYTSFSSDPGVKELFSKVSPEVLRAFGLNPETFTLFLGFYSFIFIYLNLCGAIQAMNLGTVLVSKETTRNTADFLMTKPVSRNRILTAKLLAGLTSILITDAVFIIVARVMSDAISTAAFDELTFFMISLTLFFLQMVFFAIGTIVSVIAKKIKSVISVSMSVVFAFFIIRMIGSALNEEGWRYFTPFDYFNTAYVLKETSYEPKFAVIAAVIVVAAISASYVIHSKKDIPAM